MGLVVYKNRNIPRSLAAFEGYMTQEEKTAYLLTVKWKVTTEDSMVTIEPLNDKYSSDGIKMFILKEVKWFLSVLFAQHIVELHNKSLDNGSSR